MLFLIFGLILPVSAQNTSNKGTDFWLAYGNHVAGYGNTIGQEMVVYVTSDVNTSGVMEVGGTSIPFQVTANAITNVTVPQTAYIGNTEGKISNKGIHITSLLPIVVYAHIYDQAVSGATLVLPTNTLGKDYYSLNYQQISNSPNSHSFFFVVATEDNTEIEITPSVDTQGGLKAGVKSAPIKLNKGEIYQVLGIQASLISKIVRNNLGQNVTQYTTQGGDLTGTRIQSISTGSEPCKKIAVFSGSGKIAVGCLDATGYAGSSDNLFQQAYPTASWGKTFITVPSKDRNYDVYRIFKSDPNAVVKLNGTVIPATSFINNFYYEFPSQAVNYIESNKPIQVALYAVTQGKSITCTNVPGDVGDPEMIFLNPLEQTLSQITMYSTKLYEITKHFINVVIPGTAVSGFKLDGVSQSALFKSVPDKPGYSYAQIPVNAGTHNLQASEGFNAIAYGFGNAESYGYAAGANVKGLGVEIRKASTKKQVSTVCVKEELNLSVKLNSTTNRILWDLGDGSAPLEVLNPVPVDANPLDGLYEYLFPNKVIYSELKDYKIIVTANKTSTDGCGSTEVTELQFSSVNPPSAAINSLSQACLNVPVTFRDTSAANGRKIVKWLWDFGDNTVSTDQNPTHTYTKGGNFVVKLMVEGETGCESEVISQNIHVNINPVANFSFSTPDCVQQTITFKDNSTSAEGKIIKWIWDPGDGTTPVEYPAVDNFTHSYASTGTYNASLKVLTDKGCENILSRQVIVNPVPLVNFGVPEVCIKDAFAAFTDSSSIADGSGSFTYLWNFGDAALSTTSNPNTSILKNPQHRYTRAGVYNVSLTVTSKDGCATTLIKSFTVNGAIPTASFDVLNATQLCSNKEVVFRNTSTVDFGDIGKIEWYFDFDGDQSFKLVDENPVPGKEYRIQYPLFSSPASKLFKVRMLAYSGGTCADEEIKIISLLSAPEVVFSALSDVCQELSPFKITQAAEKNSQAGVGQFYGKGVSLAGIFDPAAAGVGIHTIKYVFTAINGCADSLSRDIKVMPTPLVNAGRDTVILQGGETRLKGVASGSNLIYKWTPSIGLSRDDVPDPIASPAEDITYTLTVTSDQGCVSMDNILIKVLKVPEVPTAFTPNGDGVNDLWNIKYLDSYVNASVKVFSRYGAIVYYSDKGYSQPWNGQMNGVDLPLGTYYYIVDPRTRGRKPISGAVTILR
ncbi:PKD domain-containing protein [Daejeonella sp. H1SJ63]|uniref:PKD domain-containing protein n=1 Tax=Daejeonella sp. H1SJ63 TaxID=3034145 RepID=UPI0023EDF6CE|nr:PKD domain-containing protein [Daejeonella sp. H1SJ63]